MRCVVQKVTHSSVTVDGELVGKIGAGFMVLVGVENGDTEADAAYIAGKITGLRIFEDADDKMNLSLADARKGRRPSFIGAARPELAEPLCEVLKQKIEEAGVHVETGRFQTHMMVDLVNDGPVTILLDSKKNF